jgi:uncharacterized membrane protein YphA (DoxX/SURF4 family)
MFAYSKYTKKQFIIWRILLGIYFLIYGIALIPYVKKLYSNQGIFENGALNWTYHLFPSLFNWTDSTITVYLATFILIMCSLAFTLGYKRKLSAFLMAFILISFFNRNNLTGDPSIPFIYWLLVATIAIPDERKTNWKMPRAVYISALIVLSMGYFMGGILKILSPSWADGSAMQMIFSLPNTRFNFIETVSQYIPSWIFMIVTFSVIVLELLAPVFLIIKKTRKFWWVALTLMHLAVLTCFTITQVSIGMLLYHLFLLDLTWIRKTI